MQVGNLLNIEMTILDLSSSSGSLLGNKNYIYIIFLIHHSIFICYGHILRYFKWHSPIFVQMLNSISIQLISISTTVSIKYNELVASRPLQMQIGVCYCLCVYFSTYHAYCSQKSLIGKLSRLNTYRFNVHMYIFRLISTPLNG